MGQTKRMMVGVTKINDGCVTVPEVLRKNLSFFDWGALGAVQEFGRVLWHSSTVCAVCRCIADVLVSMYMAAMHWGCLAVLSIQDLPPNCCRIFLSHLTVD